jgi:hypothetical protein
MSAFVHADDCPCEPCAAARAKHGFGAFDFETRAREILWRLVAEDDPERTYECPICLDAAYTLRDEPRGKGHFRRTCTVTRPCQNCRAGIAIEAGEWAGVLRPRKGKTPPSQALKDQFRERLRSHPRGLQLREAFEGILAKPMESERQEQRD